MSFGFTLTRLGAPVESDVRCAALVDLGAEVAVLLLEIGGVDGLALHPVRGSKTPLCAIIRSDYAGAAPAQHTTILLIVADAALVVLDLEMLHSPAAILKKEEAADDVCEMLSKDVATVTEIGVRIDSCEAALPFEHLVAQQLDRRLEGGAGTDRLYTGHVVVQEADDCAEVVVIADEIKLSGVSWMPDDNVIVGQRCPVAHRLFVRGHEDCD